MRASSTSPLFQLLFPFLCHLWVCGYLIWLALNDHPDGSSAEKVDQVIFIDFLGFFILSFVFSKESESVRWEWPISFNMGLRIIGYIVLIIFFTWVMEGAAGWPIAIAWGFGILTNLSHIQTLRIEAIVRVVWAMISGFLAALVGSMLGVEGEDLLTDHLPTLLGWGLTYFAGVAVGSLFFGFGAWIESNSSNAPNS